MCVSVFCVCLQCGSNERVGKWVVFAEGGRVLG